MSGISQRYEAERFAASNQFAFLLWLRAVRGKRLAGWSDVVRWAAEDGVGFQDAMWDFAGVIGVKGSALSFAENVLRHGGEREALVWRTRDGARTALTRDRLRAEVAACAESLRVAGIGPDDGVGGWAPDSPVGVSAFLGANAIGAVWCFVLSRDSDLPRCRLRGSRSSATEAALPKLTVGKKMLELFSSGPANGGEWQFVRRPPNAPLAFLADGTADQQETLLSHLCEILFRADVKPDDRVLCAAPTEGRGSIWLASLLMTGATVIVADGPQSHPDIAALARIAREEGAKILAGPSTWIELARPIATLEEGSLRFHVVGGEESAAYSETPPLLRALLRTGARGGPEPRSQREAPPG